MSTDSKIEINMELLRRLHRIHRQLTDLCERRDRAPRQLQASKARVDQAEERLSEIQDRLRQAKLNADQKQSQLAEREAKVKDLEGKLNTAASNREFATFQEQIAADRQANDVLSDEILEALELIDSLVQEQQAAQEETANEAEQHQTRVADIKAKLAVVTEDLEDVEAKLVQAEAEVPAEIRGDYNRIVKAKGEEALAALEDESCAGCYQTLTTQLIDRLRMSKLVRCPSCHAFLYLPENRQVR